MIQPCAPPCPPPMPPIPTPASIQNIRFDNLPGVCLIVCSFVCPHALPQSFLSWFWVTSCDTIDKKRFFFIEHGRSSNLADLVQSRCTVSILSLYYHFFHKKIFLFLPFLLAPRHTKPSANFRCSHMRASCFTYVLERHASHSAHLIPRDRSPYHICSTTFCSLPVYTPDLTACRYPINIKSTNSLTYMTALCYSTRACIQCPAPFCNPPLLWPAYSFYCNAFSKSFRKYKKLEYICVGPPISISANCRASTVARLTVSHSKRSTRDAIQENIQCNMHHQVRSLEKKNKNKDTPSWQISSYCAVLGKRRRSFQNTSRIQTPIS